MMVYLHIHYVWSSQERVVFSDHPEKYRLHLFVNLGIIQAWTPLSRVAGPADTIGASTDRYGHIFRKEFSWILIFCKNWYYHVLPVYPVVSQSQIAITNSWYTTIYTRYTRYYQILPTIGISCCSSKPDMFRKTLDAPCYLMSTSDLGRVNWGTSYCDVVWLNEATVSGGAADPANHSLAGNLFLCVPKSRWRAY